MSNDVTEDSPAIQCEVRTSTGEGLRMFGCAGHTDHVLSVLNVQSAENCT